MNISVVSNIKVNQHKREQINNQVAAFLSQKGKKITRIANGVSGLSEGRNSMYETQEQRSAREKKKGRGIGITIVKTK
jgi:SutA RNAP-binding domain